MSVRLGLRVAARSSRGRPRRGLLELGDRVRVIASSAVYSTDHRRWNRRDDEATYEGIVTALDAGSFNLDGGGRAYVAILNRDVLRLERLVALA